MLKTIIGIVVGVCLCSAQAFSETREEELVRLSKLTISAFECSVLTDGDDAKLAFFVGLKAGEGLWDGLRKLSTDEVRTIGPKIDKLWGMVKGGTTTEFVLGGAYEAIREEVAKSAVRYGENWYERRQNMYKEKNCVQFR